MRARAFAGAFALAAVSLGALEGHAAAQSCPVPVGADPALAGIDARDRMHFLQRELGAQARYAALWQTTWFLARTAILAEEVTLAVLSPDADDRLDARITSVFAVLPPIGTILFGLRVAHDGPRFLALDHLDNDASRCALVARGEQFFARDAANEDEQRGWLQHVLHIGGSTALFLILGVGFGHWTNAIFNGLAGIALGELQILSQPTGLVGAWEHYRHAELGGKRAVTFRFAPQLAPGSTGLSLVATF